MCLRNRNINVFLQISTFSLPDNSKVPEPIRIHCKKSTVKNSAKKPQVKRDIARDHCTVTWMFENTLFISQFCSSSSSSSRAVNYNKSIH